MTPQSQLLARKLDGLTYLLKEQRSTFAYVHQFAVWLAGMCVVCGIYYNYVLMEPLAWTLFAVMFTYFLLFFPKRALVKALLWIFSEEEARSSEARHVTREEDQSFRSAHEDPEEEHDRDPILTVVLRALYFTLQLVWDCVMLLIGLPSNESSLYFGLLLRGLVAAVVKREVLPHYPTLLSNIGRCALTLLIAIFLYQCVDSRPTRLRKLLMGCVRGEKSLLHRLSGHHHPQNRLFRYLSAAGSTFVTCLLWIRRLLASVIVPNVHVIATVSTLAIGCVVLFFVSMLLILSFVSECMYLYNNTSWIGVEVMHRAAQLMDLVTSVPIPEYFTKLRAKLLTSDDKPLFSVVATVDAFKSGNFSAISIDLLYRSWVELSAWFNDQFGVQGIDTVSYVFNNLKALLLQSSTVSVAALGSGVTLIGFVFDSAFQGVVFLTLLFLMLQSEVGLLAYAKVVFHIVDPSSDLYRYIVSAVRSIFLSAVKMSLFHGCFTFLQYYLYESPVVSTPTVISLALGLVPIVSPVVVTLALPVYISLTEGVTTLGVLLYVVNFVVWWFVSPAIYSEIPDSNSIMTTIAVGLGIGVFGVRGVVIGPAIACVPFAVYNMALDRLKRKRTLVSEHKKTFAAPFPITRETTLNSVIDGSSFSCTPRVQCTHCGHELAATPDGSIDSNYSPISDRQTSGDTSLYGEDIVGISTSRVQPE